MLGLARTLVVIGIGVIASGGGDHDPVCPPEPSVCGYVEGATRYYLHQHTGYVSVAVHEDVDAATLFVAGATGIAYD